MKNVSHKTRRRNYFLVQTSLILVILVTGLNLVFGNQGLIQYWRLSQLKTDTEEAAARLAEEIGRAHHEKSLLAKDRYLERVARKELGYIEEGETILLLPEFP